MMVRILIALLALLLASTASAMDLMDLYQQAKANDARYGAAQAQFRAMQERVPQARAGVVTESDFDVIYRRHRHHRGGFPVLSFGRSHRYGGELTRPAYRSPPILAR